MKMVRRHRDGEEVEVPRRQARRFNGVPTKANARADRKFGMILMLGAGLTVERVAHAFGVGRRTVQSARAAYRKASDFGSQLDDDPFGD